LFGQLRHKQGEDCPVAIAGRDFSEQFEDRDWRFFGEAGFAPCGPVILKILVLHVMEE